MTQAIKLCQPCEVSLARWHFRPAGEFRVKLLAQAAVTVQVAAFEVTGSLRNRRRAS